MAPDRTGPGPIDLRDDGMDDSVTREQAQRLRMITTSAVNYLFCAGILGMYALAGSAPWHVALAYLAVSMAGNAVFYRTVHQGHNLRLEDPNLFGAQMVFGGIVVLVFLGWAPQVGFVDGFPAARDPKAGEAWLAHCYGALGAGRGGPPDSSNGSELYVVTGQSPRQLDRNITLVGRVVKGMELLSAIPRGPEPMGFYEKAEQRTPITAVRLARDVPESERVPLQVLRTDS